MQIADIDWQVSGDVGGVGISRFRFVRQDSATITVADANAAAAASHGVISAGGAFAPSTITWNCAAQVNVYDSVTGLVQGPLVLSTIPSPVNGAEAGPYPAGVGARIDWKTNTISTRRLIRGATFLVPLGNEAFSTNGLVQGSVLTLVGGAIATYLIAMNTAVLYPVIWKRPPKGTHAGGSTGTITAGIVKSTPAGLRSRRS